MLTYSLVEKLDWQQIISNGTFDMSSKPLAVHCPIQPPHLRDIVYIDRSLVARRLRVLPGLDQKQPETYPIINNLEMLFVQFALDEPAFVPDFNYSTLSYFDDLAPIITAEYFAWDLLYKFEYSCQRLNDSQSLLWIACEVFNDSDKPQDAVVRTNVNFQPESKICDYHYVPFYWDNSKWMPCDKLSMTGPNLIYDKNVIGKIDAGDFKCQWEADTKFTAEDYNKKFSCSKPYFVHNQFRLESVKNVIKFSRKLAPQQNAKFHVAVLLDYENVTAEDGTCLVQSTALSVKAASKADFEKSFSGKPAQIKFAKNNLGRVFNALQVAVLQMLIKFPGADTLMPIQGGSSERHFVWVWEAMCMVGPLLKCGHFDSIKKAVDFIFNL